MDFYRGKFQMISCLLIILVLMLSCNSKQKSDSNTQKEVSPILPVMPLQQQSYLFDNVELIDYIFHELPFSLSQSEKPSIQAKIAGISQDPVINSNCTPMGRVFFQVRGEIVIEADLFFAPPDCQYYIFYEDGQAVYANKMAPNNVQFYSQFLNQMNVSQ